MKPHRRITTPIALLACAGALLIATSSQAAMVGFHVDVDTSILGSNPNSPFYLDFQLNYGSGPGNTATINNFTFGGGGSAFGSPSLSGKAAGDLSTAVTLSDSSANPFNEFYQGFNPGTRVGFDILLSANSTLLTPDALLFAILDNTTFQIPTTDPNGGLSLAEFDIKAGGIVTATPFAGTGEYTGLVAAVPEPSASAALSGLAALGLAGVAVFRGRKR